jgi:hypothetical protein
MKMSKPKTVGISPKVANPTLILIAVGTLAVIAGVLLKDTIIRDTGISLLGAAGVVVVPVGFLSAPGEVVTELEKVAMQTVKLELASRAASAAVSQPDPQVQS